MTRPRKQSELYEAIRLFCRKRLAESVAFRQKAVWEWDQAWWAGHADALSEVLLEFKLLRLANTSRGRVDKTKKRRQVKR